MDEYTFSISRPPVVLVRIKVSEYARISTKAVQLGTYVYLKEDVPIMPEVLCLVLRPEEAELGQSYAAPVSLTSHTESGAGPEGGTTSSRPQDA